MGRKKKVVKKRFSEAIHIYMYRIKKSTSIKIQFYTSKEIKKANKSERWMPWLKEAMKDVISCDKLRVGANNLLSADFRMGQPVILKV